MSLIQLHDGPSLPYLVAHAAGKAFVKNAGSPVASYSLVGTLHLSKSGWLLMSVPNALARGVFQALDENGIELPPSEHGSDFNAHVSVMSPEEVELVGGKDKISERGKPFHYTLGRLQEAVPDNWPGVSKVWFVTVHSPDLQFLRRSYGLSSLPHGGDYAFHITVAVRYRGVLGRNDNKKE